MFLSYNSRRAASSQPNYILFSCANNITHCARLSRKNPEKDEPAERNAAATHNPAAGRRRHAQSGGETPIGRL